MTTGANTLFLDSIIRHQIYLLRYSGYVRNVINGILRATEDSVASRIMNRLANAQGGLNRAELARMQYLVDSISRVRGAAWDNATNWLLGQMVDLAKQEPTFVQMALNNTMPVYFNTALPTANQTRAIALSQPFQGKVMKEWALTMQKDDLTRIKHSIQMGMLSGETNVQITARVIGTATTDGVLEMTRNQVHTITRTAVQHVASNARKAFMDSNSDVITQELFVATLDSRTTPICRALDGKIFPLRKGPVPPLHFCCRSCRVGMVDGAQAGSRPAKPITQKQLLAEWSRQQGFSTPILNRDSLPRGTKADFDKFQQRRIRELVGPVPASTTYQSWLIGQSTSFQNEVLGVTKAKLFRDGGLTLDRFVDKSGNELTLQQLAHADAGAFTKAGLDPANFK